MQRILSRPAVKSSARLPDSARFAVRGAIALALVWVVVYGLVLPAIEVIYRVTALIA